MSYEKVKWFTQLLVLNSHILDHYYRDFSISVLFYDHFEANFSDQSMNSYFMTLLMINKIR